MEFKSVKAVDFEEKSAREIEQELIDKHEESSGIKNEDEPEKVVINTTEAVIENKEEESSAEVKTELDDEIVLSHIRKRFNRDDISYDNLLQKEIVEADLPEDLEALRRYKKETGRGISDFVKLNRDIDSEDPDAIIAEYISTSNPEFDREDIEFEMDTKFSYDEDMDDERDIRSKKLAKKKTLAEAKKFFTEQKEKYRAPLESREGFIPESEKELYSRYKSSIESQNENQEKSLKQSEHFSAKTNELFSNNFEGFGYKVGDSEITFKVNNAEAVKKTQSDAMNFIGKHLDENGMLKDANAYHKALNAAMDPDALFKFAYEKGAADAIEKDTMEAKNIEMKARSSNQVVNEGLRVREVNASHGSGLRIKSSKNKN
jgi:hypothetical protein